MVRAACVLGILGALAVVVLVASGREESCGSRFDTAAWKRARRDGGNEPRSLARSVTRCRYVKPGDNKAKVRRVLGEPRRDEEQTRGEYAREWDYVIGVTNDFMGPGDAQFLSVEFRRGRVTALYISPP